MIIYKVNKQIPGGLSRGGSQNRQSQVHTDVCIMHNIICSM